MTFDINDLPAIPGASRRVLPERRGGGGSLSSYPVPVPIPSGPPVSSALSAPTAPSASFSDTDVRLSEVVSALSYALDITEGQPQGHAVRTCLIGMRLAEVVRLTDQERSALFYALLLKDLGCSCNAARLCSLFGADDLTLKRAHKLTDWTSGLASAGYALSHVAPSSNPLARAWHALQLGTSEKGSGREMTATRCERGADIARMLGLDPATQHAIRALDEHWDGSGMPLGLKGNDIPLLGRIAGWRRRSRYLPTPLGRTRPTRSPAGVGDAGSIPSWFRHCSPSGTTPDSGLPSARSMRSIRWATWNPPTG